MIPSLPTLPTHGAPRGGIGMSGSAGAYLIYDATAGITLSSGVSQWANTGGGGAANLTQATSGSRPAQTAAIFGASEGIVFDGTADHLSIASKVIPETTAGSIGIVFKTGSSVVGPRVLVSQSDTAVANDWFEVGIAANGKIYIESNNAGTKHTVHGSTVLSASTVYDMTLTYDGTDWFLMLASVEENPLTIENIGAFAWAGRVAGTPAFTIGATITSGGAARFWNGSIGAVYVWAADITA